MAENLFGGNQGWRPITGGYAGYDSAVLRGGITIRYHADGRGPVRCELAGDGCRQIEAERDFVSAQDWQAFIAGVIAVGGKFQRIDFALDDRAGRINFDEMDAAVRDARVVSIFRSVWPAEGFSTADGTTVGRQIRGGSHQSDQHVAIYDKALERSAKGQVRVVGPWARVEFRAKGKAAAALAAAFAQDGPAAVRSHLYAALDFKERSASDSNRARWPTCAWWRGFLGGCDKARVVIPVRPSGAALITGRIEKAYGAYLAALLVTPYGRAWMDDLVARNQGRIQDKHEAVYASALAEGHLQAQAIDPALRGQAAERTVIARLQTEFPESRLILTRDGETAFDLKLGKGRGRPRRTAPHAVAE